MRIHGLFTPVALLVTILVCQAFAKGDTSYVQPEKAGDPVADAQAVVTVGNARFTVLTAQLIRMEWAANHNFEDHASLVFINRHLPVPHYRVSRKGGATVIETGKLKLSYRPGDRFSAENLSVSFVLNGNTVNWKPGMQDTGNLGGTLRTLDGVKGSTQLEPGLLSRDGWVLVDDSTRPLFDRSDWPWAMARPAGDRVDWYLFAYGHDYRQALQDYIQVAGRIPMPPRFAFGTWWSRYWAYTDQEFKELVRGFRGHSVPLDVLVIDMDWHPTFGTLWRVEKKVDASGHRLGWTGYTWNRLYFPDPPDFLAWAHAQGLKTTLNLHPASGVQPHEERYPEMARAMGIDPATKEYVPFDIVDKKYATNYMNILHHPLERQGVDFWWLDWQQEPTTRIPGVTPTWWLNYVHFTDLAREGKRPIIFHRWGGLGNHRYQIGFSGDTVSVWDSLAFQPYFTATAANVGYGYWSHDIGGHMPGAVSPELYLRWIQFGIFSPIVRTHTTKNPDAERRIWAYPEPFADYMRDAFRLRYAMIPYIYTASRQAYDTGISLLRPMYYDHPESGEAYQFKDQYMFGDDMLVAPITAPASEATQLAEVKLWLPQGAWINWINGERIDGPTVVTRTFAYDEIPVYLRAGAIIPMQPEMRYTGEKPVDPLILTVVPGEAGKTRVYEDAGNTLDYQHDEAAWTEVRQSTTAQRAMTIDIASTKGGYKAMPEARAYELRILASWPPQSVTVNGATLPQSSTGPGWRYDGNTVTTIISLPSGSVREARHVVIQGHPEWVGRASLLNAAAGRIARCNDAMHILEKAWPKGWAPDLLIDAAEAGERMRLKPESALEELERLEKGLPLIRQQIKELNIDEGLKARALAQLDGF